MLKIDSDVVQVSPVGKRAFMMPVTDIPELVCDDFFEKDEVWHPGFKDYSVSFDVGSAECDIDILSLFMPKKKKPKKPIRHIMLKRAEKMTRGTWDMLKLDFIKEGDQYVCKRGALRFVLQGL